MFPKMLGLAATSLALILAAATPVAAHDRADKGEGLIVAERYSAENGGNPQIVAVRPSDARVRVLTSGHQDTAADLSPDGQSIVFERCLHALNCDEIGALNIWIMRADGSHQRPLTACDGSNCLGSEDPAFSPDGRSIAFAQDLLDANGVNFQGIFIMRSDGTGLHRITSNGPDALPDTSPRFSPDGTHLVFAREVPGGSQLMIVGADGTGLRPLVDGTGPDWSPDGKHVAFGLARTTGDTTTFDIAIVRPDAVHMRPLTNEPADLRAAFEPDYSPSGRRLVFSETDASGCRLVTLGATGGHPRTLPTGEGCYFNPSWGSRP
jgi:Tol biopolymer transport system component